MGERSEFLATLAVARACSKEDESALALAAEASESAQTVEVCVLAACARAICAINANAPNATDEAVEAFQTVQETGGVDAFVTAYRGCPRLLWTLAQQPDTRDALLEITSRAEDWRLAAYSQLIETQRARLTGTPLTRREREVLDLLAQGLTNKDIGHALFISVTTAKAHVRHIMEKLDVHTRTEAALRASDFDRG